MHKLVEIPGDVVKENDEVISKEQLLTNLMTKYSADFFSKVSALLRDLQEELEQDPEAKEYFPEIAGGAFCGQIALLLAYAETESEERCENARDAMRLIGESIAKRTISEINAQRREN
jgi:hypothetical protein